MELEGVKVTRYARNDARNGFAVSPKVASVLMDGKSVTVTVWRERTCAGPGCMGGEFTHDTSGGSIVCMECGMEAESSLMHEGPEDGWADVRRLLGVPCSLASLVCAEARGRRCGRGAHCHCSRAETRAMVRGAMHVCKH